MSDRRAHTERQLGRICEQGGAVWAAFLQSADEGWEVTACSGLDVSHLSALAQWANSKLGNQTLKEAVAEGVINTPKKLKVPSANKLGVFADDLKNGLLLVGADEFESSFLNFLPIAAGLLTSPNIGEPSSLLQVEDYQHLLHVLAGGISADGAYLAARSGEEFVVQAVCQMPQALLGRPLSAFANKALAAMLHSRQPAAQPGRGVERGFGIGLGEAKKYTHWIGIPLVQEKVVAGFVAFSRSTAFKEDDWQAVSSQSEEAGAVLNRLNRLEMAARILRRFDLMETLTGLRTAAYATKEIGEGVSSAIRRAFEADAAEIMVLCSDRLALEEAFPAKRGRPRRFSLDNTLAGSVLKIGQAVRINNFAGQSAYASERKGIQAKLAVPIYFSGEIGGVLAVESGRADAFNEDDERFLSAAGSLVAAIYKGQQQREEQNTWSESLADLNRIARQISGLYEVKEIAQHVAQLAVEYLGVDLASVMLLDEPSEEWVADGVAGVGGVPAGLRLACTFGLPGEVQLRGESQLIPSLADAPPSHALSGWKEGAALCVPILMDTSMAGVILAECRQPYSLDDVQVRIFETLAEMLAAVIGVTRRYETLKDSVGLLETVRETALDIGSDLEIQALFARITTRVREMIGARGAELALVDEEKNELQVLYSDNPWKDYTGYRFPLNSGVAGHVAASGAPLVIPDFNRWQGRDDPEHQAAFSTAAGVPLMMSSEVIGTLVVQDDRPSKVFSQDDLQILELLAPQVAIFIRHARLYQELEERIRAQERAEASLVRSAKLAAVGEMAAGVAHELNNPLTTVAGFTELLLDSFEEGSRERDDLQLVLNEARRARGVVRRLLDFSRQSELLRLDTDVNEMLGNVLALVHHLAQSSNVEVRVAFWDGLPPVRADRNQLQQVFLNLIHNGIQAMPAGGQLVIRTQTRAHEDRNYITVAITDTGDGIKAENIGQIFEPFFTTKPAGKGTGLGLSVSFGIVTDHGGFIDVESKEGQGATFTVWLPVTTPAEITNG